MLYHVIIYPELDLFHLCMNFLPLHCYSEGLCLWTVENFLHMFCLTSRLLSSFDLLMFNRLKMFASVLTALFAGYLRWWYLLIKLMINHITKYIWLFGFIMLSTIFKVGTYVCSYFFSADKFQDGQPLKYGQHFCLCTMGPDQCQVGY